MQLTLLLALITLVVFFLRKKITIDGVALLSTLALVLSLFLTLTNTIDKNYWVPIIISYLIFNLLLTILKSKKSSDILEGLITDIDWKQDTQSSIEPEYEFPKKEQRLFSCIELNDLAGIKEITNGLQREMRNDIHGRSLLYASIDLACCDDVVEYLASITRPTDNFSKKTKTHVLDILFRDNLYSRKLCSTILKRGYFTYRPIGNTIHFFIKNNVTKPMYLETEISEKLNEFDLFGCLPTHYIYNLKNPKEIIKVVRFLIEKGADIDACNKKGFRPIDICIIEGSRIGYDALIKLGAQVQSPNNQGKKPIHYIDALGLEWH